MRVGLAVGSIAILVVGVQGMRSFSTYRANVSVSLDRTTFRSAYPLAPWFEDLNLFPPLPVFEARRGELLYSKRSHGQCMPLGNRIVGDGAADLILQRNLLGPPR